MKRRNARFSFAGALIFFVTLAATISATILIYDRAVERYGDNRTAIAMIVLLLIVFFTTAYTLTDLLRRRIMVDRPVERILAATEKIARGDFSVRLTPTHPYGRQDEYDAIMENLNILAEELGKSEILKTDFIANVSHELKTPLAVIQSYATGLANEKLDENTRRAYIATLKSATKKLTDLVTNVLQLNKLENSKTRPEKQWTRLDEQLAEAVVGFETQIEKKALEVEIDMQELSAFTAPALLMLVWNNLLSNAVKFTDEGGKIGVTLKRSGDYAVVKISDTGCGISPQTGKRLFDKFYQGDTSHSAEGNGLGLALVKKVIDILGGEISVASRQGEGSTFTVLIKESIKDA